MSAMLNTYARPVRDLRNNYAEIAALANAGNQIIITNNGREEVMVIGREEYKTYERFVHHEYIRKALALAKEQANASNTRWYSEEEVNTMLDEGLENEV